MIKTIFFFLIIISWSGCSENKTSQLSTPVSGIVKISADESVRPLVEAELSVFHQLYTHARIDIKYKPEQELFKDLMSDSVQMIFSFRDITEEERSFLNKIKFFPKTVRLASDAIAFIINKQNKDSLMTVDQVKNMLKGHISDWNEIGSSMKSEKIECVFDNQNSGIVRFLCDSLINTHKLPDNCFAVNSNEEVIEFVKRKKNAVGVIDVNWISDSDDTTAFNFRKDITVVSIASNGNFYKPYQAYIKLKTYPFVRNLFSVNREGRAGLATGFSAFVASDRGQRIVLKTGLVPATMPVRLVEIKENNELPL